MLILASNSPRRKEILEKAGYKFIVKPVDTNENVTEGIPPEEAVIEIAYKKAKISTETARVDDIIIGADTIVYLNGKIIGKPLNKSHAKNILQSLSGKTHYVYTGYAIISGSKTVKGYQKTAVTFKKLSETEIDSYIKTDEYIDKAGAYGMQDSACIFVKSICGDYFNVIGLPICVINEELKKFK